MLVGIYETLTVKREALSQYRMNKGYQFRNDCRCQLRDDDSLEQNGSYRSNEKWPDSVMLPFLKLIYSSMLILHLLYTRHIFKTPFLAFGAR